MKKIFNSLVLLFIFPLRSLKKTRIDNFLGGLIIGALFSLAVNIITVQIQEIVNKQRVLESIENEINLNHLQANNKISTNNMGMEKDEYVNYFYTSPHYSSDFWTQSSDSLRYVTQLDSDIQASIMLYYSLIIRNSNLLVNKSNNIINREYENCFNTYTEIDLLKSEECLFISDKIRQAENIAAQLVQDYSSDLLEVFHPTKDRQNNRFLKILLGDKAVKSLLVQK
jgi:hypothetical protein